MMKLVNMHGLDPCAERLESSNLSADIMKRCQSLVYWVSIYGELRLYDTEKKYYDQWYDKKKFAFCSDILRLHILNQYG